MRDKSRGPFFPIIKQDGLVVKILGGLIDRQSMPIEIATATLTLDGNGINFIYIDSINNEIVFDSSISEFPKNTSKALYKITTDAATILKIEDYRASIRMSDHSESKTLNSLVINDIKNANMDWTLLDLSAVAPERATALFLNIAVQDTGTPSSDVYASFRKPGESGLGRESTVYPNVSGLYMVATGVIGMDDSKRIEYKINVNGTFVCIALVAGWLFGRDE